MALCRTWDAGWAIWLEVSRCGCTVTAIDASPSAVVRIRATAREEHHAVEAIETDLAEFQIAQDYDRNVNWLVNVLRRTAARAPLRDIQDRIRLGGLAVVNTTYMDMFTPGEYHLLRREDLIHRFADWVVEVTRYDDFRAPLDTVKVFATVIKRKPEGGSWRRGSRGAMELSLRGSL